MEALSMPKLIMRRLADDWKLLVSIFAGIALAAMLLGGNRFLPAIWLGGFIAVNVTSGSVLMALLSACGTTFAAWLARTALTQLHPQDTLFDGLLQSSGSDWHSQAMSGTGWHHS